MPCTMGRGGVLKGCATNPPIVLILPHCATDCAARYVTPYATDIRKYGIVAFAKPKFLLY